MRIAIKEVSLKDVQGIIVPVFEDREAACSEVEALKKEEVFAGKEGEIFYYTKNEEGFKYIILVGLGKVDECRGEAIRNAVAKGAKKAKELKLKTVGIRFIDTEQICVGGRVRAITEGLRLALYTFDKYKTDAKAYEVEAFIYGVPEDKVEKAADRLQEVNNLIDGVIIARNLVNEPANVIVPSTLADEAVRLGQESGFEVEVLDEEVIKALGMEAFMAVAKGSDNRPKLIVMRYMGAPENSHITGLVGKGLTYDTGGYSLKPNDSMKDMKSDMGGAAAVIGTMSAIAKNKLPNNVIAVVAACENAISGGSYKPGDIIGSMGGKTIEVLNTDAEGRLTLADAVTYIIEKEKVSEVIDVATLTGAALVALGVTTTAVVGNDDALYDRLIEASNKTREQFWRLPSTKDYLKLIKSDVADLKNIGGRYAGTITGGLFVGEFAGKTPWMHLDVAGTAWADSPNTEYQIKGGTGVPVRTLYYLVKGPCACHK